MLQWVIFLHSHKMAAPEMKMSCIKIGLFFFFMSVFKKIFFDQANKRSVFVSFSKNESHIQAFDIIKL